MTGHGSDEPPLEILKETKEPWEERLDKLRDQEWSRQEIDRLRAQNAALLAALGAQEAYENKEPAPWGHDCRWCGACMDRVAAMRRAAIAVAEGGEWESDELSC